MMMPVTTRDRPSISCLIGCLLLGAGCSPATTITVMQHGGDPAASFSADHNRCCEIVDKSRSSELLGWSWRIALYELHNANAYRDVQVWRCLAGRGWQPAIQAIGPTRASEQDFRRALHECTVGTQLAGLIPERLSGAALTAIADHLLADDSIMGAGRAITICLNQRQWRLVRGAACLEPGRDAVARSLLLPPIIPEFAGKFAPAEGALILDTGQGIRWRKGQPSASRSAVPPGIDQIDAECRGSFQDALNVVGALNRRQADGRSDWRLPRVDEAESLANYAFWSGMQVPGAKPRKILSLAWTGEKNSEGAPLAVDLATGRVVALGTEGMYCAEILPVSGAGWSSPPATGRELKTLTRDGPAPGHPGGQ